MMSDETRLQRMESRLELLEEKQRYLWSAYLLIIRNAAKRLESIELEEAEV